MKLSFPNDDSVEDVSEEGDEEIIEDVRLSVTQSDDPLSGGHFALGMSKPPPRPAREGSRVVVHRAVALEVANSDHARSHVGRESPISNGLTTVGGANTRLLFRNIGKIRIRHWVPTCSRVKFKRSVVDVCESRESRGMQRSVR